MRISTIIPSYNRADLIGETLRSVLSQTRPPAEVIVVDDGSTDGTVDAIAAFGRDVTLIRQTNAGAGAARNAGLAQASGDIIHFMDSDDVSSLNSYDVQAHAIESGADMVYGPWLKARFAGNTLHAESKVLQQRAVPGRFPIDQLVLSGRWVTVFQPCLFHRRLIDAAGPYRTDLKPSEDTEMLYRLTRAARGVSHVKKSILLYRVHPENQVSSQNVAKRRIDWANLWTIMQRHADDRDDLGRYVRTQVRIRKLDAAAQLRGHDPARAGELERGARGFDWVARRAQGAIDRVDAKLRHILVGYRSNGNFSVDGLCDGQRYEIQRLGYVLADTPLAEQ